MATLDDWVVMYQTGPMTLPVLITGASRGLGAAMALALAPQYPIVAVAKTVGGLEALDDQIQAQGGSATLAPMDITNDDAMRQLCRSIYDRWGGITAWVHTAIHAAPLAPTDHIDAKDWAKSQNVNIQATAALIPMVAPLLGAKGTALFFDDPVVGQKFFGAYGATKAAQIALARTWQAETRNTGPRVEIATPAPMPTAVRARFFPGEDRSPLAQPLDQANRILRDINLI